MLLFTVQTIQKYRETAKDAFSLEIFYEKMINKIILLTICYIFQ